MINSLRFGLVTTKSFMIKTLQLYPTGCPFTTSGNIEISRDMFLKMPNPSSDTWEGKL